MRLLRQVWGTAPAAGAINSRLGSGTKHAVSDDQAPAKLPLGHWQAELSCVQARLQLQVPLQQRVGLQVTRLHPV